MAEESGPKSGRSLPSRIGRYRIVARIGRGAMGVVYSAVDEVMGRQIALKVLMADLEADPETRARFYREAQAAARLLHPNIITVHDAGEEQGRSYIAMQLLHGAPLAAYLNRPEAAPLERKLDLMVQVCEGLAAAHTHGIIHRDLKPNNLFVESDGLLKILDFGVARFTDSSMTAAGTMLGTPDYMSPEQARGSQVDARSDIFSAGAVFYFMLAGHKPFPGPDLPAVLHQLQHEETAPLRGVPPDLAAIVSQAMAKDPEQRPPRVEQLLASLVRFRRQYQAETRRLVFSVRARFEEVENLVLSLDEAGAALGLTDIAPAEALHRLREAFPSFSNRATTVEPSSFERTAVNAVAEAVETQRTNLTALLETRQAHVVRMKQGKRALDSGDALSALATFEAILGACPGASRAGEMAETCRPLAREQEERTARINDLLVAAQAALQAHNWTTAAAHSHEVLALDGGHPVASGLLREAERAIVQEQQRIAAIIQRLVDRASDAIGRRSFEEAEAALREAEAIQRDNPGIAAARQHLVEERAAAEAEVRLQRLTADEVRRARAVFRRGRYDEAVQQLRAFLELEPDAQEAAVELDHLVSLNAAIATAAETSRGHVRGLLNTATAAARDGRLDEAILATREALGWDPASADASQMLDMLLRHQLEARLAHERTQMREQRSQECAPLVAAARDALDRGYVAVALDAALAARRIAPDHPEIGPLIEKAQQELNSDDAHPFDLASLPWPEAGPPPQKPKAGEEGGMFDWATHLFRGGLRRRKA